MTKKVTQNEIRLKQLKALVAHHRQKYYTEDDPELSDEAYDALAQELVSLEELLEGKKSAVTESVGAATSNAFKKVKHAVPQWSFDNVFSQEELVDWEARLVKVLQKAGATYQSLTYVTEHKIDGLKLVLEYQAGVLVRAATRGDGEVGEDVTHTAKTIKSLPQQLKFPVDLLCVGEVWLSKDDFVSLNEKRAAAELHLFANPRNAAAGSLRQLDPEVARVRNLSLFVYDIDKFSPGESSCLVPETQFAELALLRKLGFPVNQYARECASVAEIQTYYEEWKKPHENLPYGVDGVVIKLNDVALQKLAGYTAKSPRYGVAYKFPAVETTTIVEAIELQVGRTGVVTPVAHLRPVVVDGSRVARATLHNEDQIKRLDVRVGDTIILRKAGDVIPEVVKVITELRPAKSTPYRFPKKVALCGGDGSIVRVTGTAAYRCASLDSDFLKRQRLYYFVSKTALNIDGVGPRIIDALLDAGLINDAADLFTLSKEDFLTLEGFKDKSASNAVEAIAAVRETTFSRLLVSLSIEHVGEETARLLASQFTNPKALRTASLSTLEAIYGIGEVVAQTLVDWQQNPEAQTLLDRLLKYISFVPEVAATAGTALAGQSFVFTGTLTGLSRTEAEEMVRQAGGSVMSAVSKKTSYVVAGADPGSKVEQAKKLNVKILTQADFLKHIAG